MSDDKKWVEVGGNPQYEMWDENKDKTIMGKFVEVRRNVGKNGSNIYVLETANGEKRGVWGSTVLDARFENIQTGMEVMIEFLGKTPGKDARGSYKNYKVFMRAPEASQEAPAVEAGSKKSDDLPF